MSACRLRSTDCRGMGRVGVMRAAGSYMRECCRCFLFQQSTNCANSLAHRLGDQPYTDAHSPCDHIATS
ncbi:hypothetical protein F5X97DRAFT_289151 [Nemania serpens]|nr:hypothetical protein F5X97DRAFT_289151 [Nemania serpens]